MLCSIDLVQRLLPDVERSFDTNHEAQIIEELSLVQQG